MSLFALSADSEDEDGGSFFRHSARDFQAIVAEQGRQFKEKAVRTTKQSERRANAERRANGKRKSDEFEEPDTLGAAKRRRSMSEDIRQIHSPNERVVRPSETNTPAGVARRPSPSPRGGGSIDRESRSPVKSHQAAAVPLTIDLDDNLGSDGAVEEAIVPPTFDDDSDDEFADIARQARAMQKQKKQQGTPLTNTQTKTSGPPPPLSTAADPVVHIFLSSPIPNTKPLLVFRKLSQRLQEVRQTWCDRQNFPPELSKEVFLTYRLRKIYDASTCRSLGLYVDSAGNLVMKGAEGINGIDKVHLEAMTEDILTSVRQQSVEERQAGSVESRDANSGATRQTSLNASGIEEQSTMRLVLKAKNRPDYKLRVKPATTISRIVNACRKNYDMTDNDQITLNFDGEPLNPEDQIQNTELSDMDCIHVHI